MENPSRSSLAPPLVNLALIPSFECDVACHHCVFESSPKSKGRLPLELALSAIAEFRRLAGVQRIVVSGGEAALDWQYLLALARATSASGALFRFVTNASFAVSRRAAVECLTEIASVGLETLGISWDSFHERFIPASNVQNALLACRDLGISARITVVSTKSHRIGEAIEKLGETSFEIPITEVRCLPVGRARKKIGDSDLLDIPEWERNRACRNDFDTASITFDGSVYPCCAVGGFTEGIRLGNITTDPVDIILSRRANNLRWLILAAQGPRYYLQFATTEELNALNIRPNDHDCVVCNRLFESPLGHRLHERATRAIDAKVEPLAAGLLAV